MKVQYLIETIILNPENDRERVYLATLFNFDVQRADGPKRIYNDPLSAWYDSFGKLGYVAVHEVSDESQ